MKKRIRNIPLQFWVSSSEKSKLYENMKRNGMTNLSEFLRILALSEAEVNISVRVPNVVRVSEASLGSGAEEGRDQKRASG